MPANGFDQPNDSVLRTVRRNRRNCGRRRESHFGLRGEREPIAFDSEIFQDIVLRADVNVSIPVSRRSEYSTAESHRLKSMAIIAQPEFAHPLAIQHKQFVSLADGDQKPASRAWLWRHEQR